MKRRQSIRKKILVPICLLLLVQAVLLGCGIQFFDFFQNIDDNAFSNMKNTVISQGNEIEEAMVTRWANLDVFENSVNESYERLKKEGIIQEGKLETDEKQYNAFLKEVLPSMVSTIRTNKVNGVYFVLLSEKQLEQEGERDFPGVYIEDQDVTSSYNESNQDLLFLRSPLGVAKESGISTKQGWSPVFHYAKNEKVQDFIEQPIKAIQTNPSLTYDQAVYWGRPTTLEGKTDAIVTCSVPVVDHKGKVYGVIGVSLNESYIQDQLSYGDLAYNKNSAYSLVAEGKNGTKRLLDNGSSSLLSQISKTYTTEKQNGIQIINGGGQEIVYGYTEKLHIYDTSSPFAKDEWSLVGMVPKDTLLSLTSQTKTMLLGILVAVFASSLLGSVWIAKRISNPVVLLTKEVEHADVGENTFLKRSNVYELDFLARAIENLSKEAYISAGTFTRILEMSSVKMGGFEYDERKSRFLITNQFFEVFHHGRLDGRVKDWDMFQATMEKMEEHVFHMKDVDGGREYEYKIIRDQSEYWVRMKVMEKDNRIFGLVEDITAEKMQIQKVEYERDHDVLTNLLNRRAFQRRTNELFASQENQLKTAALMMLDLDNLKYINDNFGHDAGDNYIICMANHLQNCVKEHTLVARMSGDEFYIFFYGYDEKQEIKKQVQDIYEKMEEQSITLPNGERHFIRASAGIAWYPMDADNFAQLLLYADFAMYKVKNSVKGDFAEFNKESYQKEAYLVENRESLHKMISKELVDFHFQPIVDIKTGTTFGFEALMRPQIPELSNVEEMIKLARQEGMLQRVETLTMFKAMELFIERSKGLHNQESKVFINSISSQKISKEKAEEFTECFHNELHRIVLEITEVTEIDEKSFEMKKKRIKSWNGQIALDDFGSGYNGDVALLKTNPDFVKVDIGIITKIDKDPDKQQLVKHLIDYAQPRNIKIIAEGVETKEELDTVVELGVDYVQGFYLARPNAMPCEVDI